MKELKRLVDPLVLVPKQTPQGQKSSTSHTRSSREVDTSTRLYMIGSELSKQNTSRPLATQRSLPEVDRTSALTGRANFFSANNPRPLRGSRPHCRSLLSSWITGKMVSPVLRDQALTLLSSPAAKTKFDDGSTQNPCAKASVWDNRFQIRGGSPDSGNAS